MKDSIKSVEGIIIRNGILFFLLFFSFEGYAQNYLPFDSLTGKITYKQVAEVANVNKKELFDRALRWIAIQTDSGKKHLNNNGFSGTAQTIDVIEQNRDSGIIIGKSKFKSGVLLIDGNKLEIVHYKIILEFKDGKSRIKITDLNYNTGDWTNPSPTAVHSTFESKFSTLEKKSGGFKDSWLDFFEDCDKKIKSILASYQLQMKVGVQADNW